MTPDQAADLAARTLAAIARLDVRDGFRTVLRDADRERVASDLAMLTFYDPARDNACWLDYAVANLRRTAALYGETL